ncbi:MAG: SUMF1/EgtB/PvdO family nonheme iron enzyme [Thermoleophilaceae bacterium]
MTTPTAATAPTRVPEARLLDQVRSRTLALVAHLTPADLERVLDPLMSPLAWDLAHIAAYEDLWLCHRHGGRALLHPELAALYDAFETPRAVRGDLPLLDTAGTLRYLDDVRGRSLCVLGERGRGDGTLVQLVLRHELQHTETMRQAMALADLLPAGEPPAGPTGGATGWVEVPGGTFAMGAGADGFAYDNERPRHTVDVPAFAIARRPVTNAAWRAWVEAEGHDDRSTAVTGHPEAPVCHVSWHDADAFARAAGARLPTEAEWEKAHAAGALDDTGFVWEWTSTPFAGYPGFRAHPYREYSEVFFGDAYRVLRGGSWATDRRIATPTFRNWDLPERRQIFSGVRLARDVEEPA